MTELGRFYVGNDNELVLDGLVRTRDHLEITEGVTVEATVYDALGSAVLAGIGMAYDPGARAWIGVVPHDSPLERGEKYRAVADVVGLVGGRGSFTHLFDVDARVT
ncbi:MAG: hypothetical protein LC798_13765 [Chloroflexi bacterium]|nr:hypothetical protein [Chloroflexota bacterium]